MRYEYEKEPLTDINDVIRFLKQSPQNPYYDFDTDYTTNSPNYYDYLAKLKPLIQILAERIYDYDKELAKRFEEWDKRIENLPKELEELLIEWLKDGTLEDIINENIFNDLNDKIDNKAYQEGLYYSVKDYFNVVADGITDDTENMQLAIDSGLPLALPAGEILITEPLKIKPNTKITGLGIYKSIIKSNNDITVIDGSDYDIALTDIHLKDFGIIGENIAGSKGINLEYYTNNSNLENIRVEKMDTGVRISKSWYAKINRLRIINNLSSNLEIYGSVNLEQVNGLSINECTFFNAKNNVIIHGESPHQNISFNSCELEASKETCVFARNVSPLVFRSCYFERNYTNAQVGKGTEVLTENKGIDIDLETFSNRNILIIEGCYINRSINWNTGGTTVSIKLGDRPQIIAMGNTFVTGQGGVLDYDIKASENNTNTPFIRNNSREGYAKSLFSGKLNKYRVTEFTEVNFRYTNTSKKHFTPFEIGNYHMILVFNDNTTFTNIPAIRFINDSNNTIVQTHSLGKKEFVKGESIDLRIGSLANVPRLNIQCTETDNSNTDVFASYLIYREDFY